MIPNLLLPANSANQDAEVANLQVLAADLWSSDEEIAREKRVALCRDYLEGDHVVYLSKRLRRFLNLHESEIVLRLNVFRTVVAAVAERIVLEGAKPSKIGATATADSGETSPNTDPVAFVLDLIDRNNILIAANSIHERATNEGEFFLIPDVDPDGKSIRLYPHARYVAEEFGGDGFGCRVVYANDDPSQEVLFGAKRWAEVIDQKRTIQRMNLYFPDRIEKYFAESGRWNPYIEEGSDSHVIDWTDANGDPLGVAVIPFNTPELRPEAWEAIPIQDSINKMLADVLASGDSSALRIFRAFGFRPTSDGKDLSEDGSNELTIEPGQIIGTASRSPSEASFDALEAGDLNPLIDALSNLILFVAMVTDTPVQRFLITKAIAAEGTQKEGRDPLVRKTKRRIANFVQSWRQVFRMSARLAKLNGFIEFDPELAVDPIFADPDARTMIELLDELKAKREALKIPLEILWEEAGYSPDMIERMKKSPEYLATLALANLGLNERTGSTNDSSTGSSNSSNV